jgi:transposase
MNYFTAVGLDVHARSIVACALDRETGEFVQKRFAYDAATLIAWLSTLRAPLRCLYETGPCGFDLYRKLNDAGIDCAIGATSKLVMPTGRIKTDERDARALAVLLANGCDEAIWVPSEEQERIRDIVRIRQDVSVQVTQAKHRLSKWLLKKGYCWDKSAWTKQYRTWMQSLPLESQYERLVFDEMICTLNQAETQKERLDKTIGQLAETKDYQPLVRRLCALRGIGTLSAFSIIAEIGDFSRFRSARKFCTYLGLVPSLSQSGQSIRQGSLTKCGNSRVRKLLIEACWHTRKPYRPGAALRELALCEPEAAAKADYANRRLQRRTLDLLGRHKHSCKVNAAVARELAGCIWALATER